MTEFSDIYSRYQKMISERSEHSTLWRDISKYTGINVDIDYGDNQGYGTKSEQRDQYIDDPTSAIAVNQFGDYLMGVLWGNGEGVFKVKPSRYVLETADAQSLRPFFEFVTDQTLYHMNHPKAGLRAKLNEYAYDQGAFGNSAIGVFKNQRFLDGVSHNALLFRSYGVDNGMIDEGLNGLPEYFDCTYNWRTARIVNEFCCGADGVSKDAVEKLPDSIRKSWEKGDINGIHKIVFALFPRDDYNPKLQGKRGTPYRGVWFMANGEGGKFFYEEDFYEKSIAWCRMIKMRGHVYGRSSGTMLLSTIRSVNFMLGTGIDVIEKMANPSLGTFNAALFGDSVLDTSPNGMNIFNQSMMGSASSPIFPIYDVGDPKALLEFLVPFLNDKVTTAFKVDALLDFNNQTGMTATESMQRFTIRSKSISGILSQQKNELLDVIIPASIGILWRCGELGVDPQIMPDKADELRRLGKSQRIIPDAVLRAVADGKPWFELEYNNEMDRMLRADRVQHLLQVVQSTLVIAQAYPQIIEAVDWYKLLAEINENLDTSSKILLTEREFKQKIQQIAQAQQAQMQLQAGQQMAAIDKDAAQAEKMKADAKQNR